mmetsp:Transcript_30840/g.57836  ORF Transcript_30840/g.57836 Transcript_30840/m.57836 type:complete len:149 (+) Transcript_30840:85-531(+)
MAPKGLVCLVLTLHGLSAERPQATKTIVLHRAEGNLGEPNASAVDKDEAFNYTGLTASINQLQQEAAQYEDQVKGPVVDHADTWLQQKSRYQEYVKELDRGMTVQKQLVHKLRTDVKKKATEDLKKAKEAKESEEKGGNQTAGNATAK